MLIAAFSVAPYPTSLSILGSYQLWFVLRLMTQLDRVSCDQSTGMKAVVQTRHSPQILKAAVKAEECSSDRGYLWQGRLRLLARKDKQSISQRGVCVCVVGGVVILMPCL